MRKQQIGIRTKSRNLAYNHFDSHAKLILLQNKTYIQKSSLKLGATTSFIRSEFYLQYIEHTKIFDILRSSKIEGYYRYVDYILKVYKKNHNDLEEVHELFNNVTTGIKFTLKQKKDKKLKFLNFAYLEQRTDYPSIYLDNKRPLTTLSHLTVDTHWSITWPP